MNQDTPSTTLDYFSRIAMLEPFRHSVSMAEISEVTGLRAEPEQLTGIYKHMGLGVVALVFRARVLGGTPAVTDEAAEILWMDRDQVATLMTEAFAIRVIDALDGPWPHIRHHDGTRLLPPTTGGEKIARQTFLGDLDATVG
jgi:hypothetical protein